MAADYAGTCHLCQRTLGGRGMTAHLRTCRERQAPASDGRRRLYPTFGIAIRSTPTYWLHVEVRQDATFQDLDRFLRRTWLECCGHLSEFAIQGVRVAAPCREEEEFSDLYTEESVSFDCRLRDLLFDGAKFQYEYDFGSTTRCTLRVTAVRTAPLKAGEVWLLARNDPPRLVCDHCGALATAICTECIWDEEGLLCAEHLATHACGKDMCLPVVNSPRTGVCGYSGGAEDPDN